MSDSIIWLMKCKGGAGFSTCICFDTTDAAPLSLVNLRAFSRLGLLRLHALLYGVRHSGRDDHDAGLE